MTIFQTQKVSLHNVAEMGVVKQYHKLTFCAHDQKVSFLVLKGQFVFFKPKRSVYSFFKEQNFLVKIIENEQ